MVFGLLGLRLKGTFTLSRNGQPWGKGGVGFPRIKKATDVKTPE